jgi:membrane protease subunit HflK
MKKKFIIPIVVLAIVVLGLTTSVYTVDPDSEAVVKRFGRYVRTTGPGIHLNIPFGIESVGAVPVRRIQKEEFGFRTLKAGVKSEYVDAEKLERVPRQVLYEILRQEEGETGRGGVREAVGRILSNEYLMLTGDLNIADVEWIVQYKIKDPVAYLFNVRNKRKTVRDMSEAAMRLVVGDASIDEVITIGRVDIQNLAEDKLQKILDFYRTGIQIVAVRLQSVNPPEIVRPAFNEVNEAKQDRERMVNEAWKAYQEVIPKARGEAEKMVKEAEGYAVERVNRAEGEAKKFLSVYKEYKLAKDVTRRRLYLETLREVLPKLGNKWIIEQKGAEGGILQMLNIGGEKE